MRSAKVVFSDSSGKRIYETIQNQRVRFYFSSKINSLTQDAIIEVFDIDEQGNNDIIMYATRCELLIGESEGNYYSVFAGDIVSGQNIVRDNERYTSYSVVDGERLISSNMCLTVGSNTTYGDILRSIINESDSGVEIGIVTEEAENKRVIRGCSVFGSPESIIKDIEKTIDAIAYVESSLLYLLKEKDFFYGTSMKIDESELIGVPGGDEWYGTFDKRMGPNHIRAGKLITVNASSGVVIASSSKGDTSTEEWIESAVYARSNGHNSLLLSVNDKSIWR